MKLLKTDGVTLAYRDLGDDVVGPPIVLLHGFPFHGDMWNAQIAALQQRHRVIVPDLRGFGGSTLTIVDIADGVPMERFAADVLAVLDDADVPEPIVLVGFSMGGYAALQFALRWPQRLLGLVLCDTRAAADAEEGRRGRQAMAAAALAAGNSSPAEAMLPKLLAPQALAERPEVVATVRQFIAAASAEAIAAAQRGMARREDVRSRLKEIAVPVLALVGASDAISPPAEMREIAAALPQATFVEIPNSGHSTPLENPAAVSEAIARFAREVSR